MKSVLPTLAVLLLVVGCGQPRQPDPLVGQNPSPKPPAAKPQSPLPDVSGPPEQKPESLTDGSTVTTRTTGETDVKWPSYDLPLVVQVEVPEVPEGIVGPSPEIPPDEAQDQD